MSSHHAINETNSPMNITSCTPGFQDAGEVTQGALFRTLFAVLLALQLFFSGGGGLFVCHVIRKQNLTAKTLWIYLFCLALCDMTASFTSIPLTLLATIYAPVLDVLFLCNISGVIITFFGNWSIMTIAMISIHRYIAISKPIQSLTRKVYRDVIGYLLTSLTLSVFLALSPVVGFSQYYHCEGRPWCELHSHDQIMKTASTCMLFAFTLVLPILIVIATTIGICYKKCQKKDLRLAMENVTQMKEKLTGDERLMVNTTTIIVVIFFFLHGPSIVHDILLIMDTPLPLWYTYLVYFLKFTHGTVNAIVYIVRHQQFKEEAKSLLLRCLGKEEKCRYSVDLSNVDNKVVS